MLVLKLWAGRIAVALGCVVLLACSIGSAMLLVPRSWHDLDDANVRMHVFHIHGFYDWDFIWSAIAFATIVVVVVAISICCVWMCWILLGHWNMSTGKAERQRPDVDFRP